MSNIADAPQKVLGNFPGPVTLYPSRAKWLRISLLGAVLAAVAAVISRHGDVMAMLVTAFFALMALLGMVALLPGANSLRLSRDGFDVTTLFRRQRLRWEDVKDFAVIRVSRASFVGFNRRSPAHGLGSVSAGLTGCEGSLPDSYGMSAEGLADVMNRWRRLAAGQR